MEFRAHGNRLSLVVLLVLVLVAGGSGCMMDVLSDPDFKVESVEDEILERLRALGYLQ